MALKAILDSLEGVDEAVAPLYVEREIEVAGDGGKRQKAKRYVLDVEPAAGYALGDMSGVKGALAEEREKARQAREALQKFGDLDPDEARQWKAKLDEYEGLNPEEEADRIAAKKLDAWRSQVNEKHAKELAERDTKAAELEAELARRMVDAEATAAITAERGSVPLLLRIIKDRTRVVRTDDGKRVLQVLDEKGNPAVGDGGADMDIAGLVRELKADPAFAGAFEGKNATGSGAGEGDNPQPNGTPKKITRKQFHENQAQYFDKVRTGEVLVVDD